MGDRSDSVRSSARCDSALDENDVASLQSIIAMMRQTIDQTNREKDLLERRLTEEQERSQMELRAFARTLEGVDDLRRSAEVMSREIRRIKVRGYRPTRSDLMGIGGGLADLEGRRGFGELAAAVEASESMEEAIRIIECQNDAMEGRRRTVASDGGTGDTAASSDEGGWPGTGAEPAGPRGGPPPLALALDDDDREGGFLSFWKTPGAGDRSGGDASEADGTPKREERKKKSRRRKKKTDGSVLTSFF